MAGYQTRLATRISAEVDERLRLLAHVRRAPLSRLITELLDRVLPTADELADQIRKGNAGHENS